MTLENKALEDEVDLRVPWANRTFDRFALHPSVNNAYQANSALLHVQKLCSPATYEFYEHIFGEMIDEQCGGIRYDS